VKGIGEGGDVFNNRKLERKGDRSWRGWGCDSAMGIGRMCVGMGSGVDVKTALGVEA
jgi:hypothetical protein